jgi:hypothetical protein
MRALVLGGGGPLAVVWQTRLLAGLPLVDADLVLGISAGAIDRVAALWTGSAP